MMIEKLLVAGRKGGPELELEFREGLLVVLARAPEASSAFLDAMASIGLIGIEEPIPHLNIRGRVCVTVVDDNQKRIMLVRHSPSEPSVRAVDLDTGRETEVSIPIAERMVLSEGCLAHGDGDEAECGVWKVPIRLLLGEQGSRLEKAASVLGAIMTGSGENLPDLDGINREVERIARLRTRRAELRMRIAWLVERISFLELRISAIDASLRARAECDDIEEYVKSLKEEFECWRVSLADALAARKSVEKARSELSEYSGMGGAFHPRVAGEIRSLMWEMSELEKRAATCESEQSKVSSKLTGLRAEIALVRRELGDLEAGGFSRRTLEQARSSVKDIEDTEASLMSLYDRIAQADKASGRKKLADGLSVGGALVTVVSLTGLLLPGNVFPFVHLSEPLMGLLILSLSAGLMCTVYGLSAGMELDAKEGVRKELDRERINLSNRVAWLRRKLESSLGGASLNEYGLAVENMEWLRERKACLSEEVKELSDELAKLKNGSNLVHVKTLRAKERLAEMMKMSGFASPSRYLEAYESYRMVEARYREAADRMESALEGRSEAAIERDMEIALEEIATAEAQRASIADPRSEGKIQELSEEYAVKADEREELVLELAEKNLELADVEHALASVDMWEVSSAAAEAASELELMRIERSAAGLALAAIEEMIEDRRAQAASELGELASEIVSFFTGEPGARISCDVQEDHATCSIPPSADIDLLVPLAALAVRLGASEAIFGKGTLPLIISWRLPAKRKRSALESAWEFLVPIWPALEKLARTRQVILLLEGSDSPGSVPPSCEIVRI